MLYIYSGLFTAKGRIYQEYPHNARNIPQHQQPPPYSPHKSIPKTNIYIDQNSIDLAQNITNIQYIYRANLGVGQVPTPGQTNQLPQKCLIVQIAMSCSNPQSRSTTDHKANMRIGRPALKARYCPWAKLTYRPAPVWQPIASPHPRATNSPTKVSTSQLIPHNIFSLFI